MQTNAHEFTNYYEKHRTRIFNYILYRVGFNHSVAEDLTSEIFLKAFEHFDRYDRERPFKTWIFTIAHNHLVNYYASRKETIPFEKAYTVLKDEHYDDQVDHSLEMNKVLALISKLPVYQKELIIMRYINDLTSSEIAQITGKEEGAIRVALSRATATLRNQYSIHYPGSPVTILNSKLA